MATPVSAAEDDPLAGVVDQLHDLLVEAEAAGQRMPEIMDAVLALAVAVILSLLPRAVT